MSKRCTLRYSKEVWRRIGGRCSATCKYSRGYPDPDAILLTWNDNRSHKTELKQISQIQHSGYNIMVVDDEKDILYGFDIALTDNGYNVESFSDSHKALERFAKVSVSPS